MPLHASIDSSGLLQQLSFKVLAGLPQDGPKRFNAYHVLSHRYSLPGLYPPDIDNIYLCFCKCRAQLIATSTVLLGKSFGNAKGRSNGMLFHWGCAQKGRGCAFCVPCGISGIPYRSKPYPKEGFYNELSGNRVTNHFGICPKHVCAVGIFRGVEPEKTPRRYTLLVENGDMTREVFWDVPAFYGQPFTLYVCPKAQVGECSHIFQVVRRQLDEETWVDYVMQSSTVNDRLHFFFASLAISRTPTVGLM